MPYSETKADPLERQGFALSLAEVQTIRWALLVLRAHPERGGAELGSDAIVELERKLIWREEV